MSDELKNCPFCGSTDIAASYHSPFVVCGNCNAYGPGNADSTEAEAIAAWNTRVDDENAARGLRDLFGVWKADEPKICELEETESYECRRFDTADPKLYATRLTVHVLECSECGRTCEHVNGTYPRCPYCSSVNVLDENYEPQVIKNAESYKLADDSRPQIIDSREKLEADVYRAAEEMEEFTHGEKFINTNKILRWLDRQASITEREVKERVNFSLITQTANALFPDYQARVAELQERVDSLTAEVEAQRKRANDAERGVLSEEWYVCRDRYEDDIAELTDERDELHEKLKRNAKDYLRTLIHLTAERDELKERVARFDSISSLDGIANLLIQFEDLTAERDKLREQLADKQHVCDVQRDSFLKLEAENRELQDVCGELERTIENLRGD